MNTEITIVLRSVTYAEKSRRLLLSAGIPARVVKPSPTVTGKGCGYGVSVSVKYKDRAIGILEENRIPVIKITHAQPL